MGTAICRVTCYRRLPGILPGRGGGTLRRGSAAALLGARPFSSVAPFYGRLAPLRRKDNSPRAPPSQSPGSKSVAARPLQPGPECWSGFPFPEPDAAGYGAARVAPRRGSYAAFRFAARRGAEGVRTA